MNRRTGRPLRRAAYGALGVGLAAFVISEVVRGRTGLWHLVAFALAPDLPLIFGATRERGRIRRWAVRPYNATHRFVGPVVVAAISLGLGAAWLVGAAAWGAHIAIDRSLGFDLRAPDGFPRVEPHPPRLVLRALAGLVAATVVAGAVYEALAARGDPERYPSPGRLVAVGDNRLHLRCHGTGEPTVVLEAGLGEASPTWSLVQRELAAAARACAYDRAGYGWSEPGPSPRTPVREAAELHDLLEAAGECGPYLLVAHSIGANVTRLFVDRYREEVAGVVLVEPTDEGAVVRVGRPFAPIAQYRAFSLLARLGAVRLFGRSLVPWMVGTEPPPEVLAAAPVVYGAHSLDTAAEELEASVEGARAVTDVSQPGAWGDLPLVVVTAEEGGDPRFGERVAALSRVGRHVVAEGSGHYVQYDRPQLIVDAILEVVEQVRL
ncbi:MAG: alpha/beta fold hydrolase [Actinomycetota bacterium]